ncbi:hypothetical protein FOA52_008701 [Chlamydomonas sp. UWO 241]|nr:hypothetical protein FOA52_008701 [Chlamydomonas sp. UWO 241]
MADSQSEGEKAERLCATLRKLSSKGGYSASAAPAVAAALPRLVHLLAPDSPAGADRQLAAIDVLIHLDRCGHGAAILSSDALAPIVALLGPRYQADGVQELAAACLANIAVTPKARVAVAAAGAIPPLVALLAPDASVSAQGCAAGALRSLAVNLDTTVAIGAAGGMPPLLRLLARGGSSPPVQEIAAHMVCMLVAPPPGHAPQFVAANGVIPALVALLARSDTPPSVRAKLAADVDAHRAAIFSAGAVPPLMKLLRPGSTAQLQAAGALGQLAQHAESALSIASAGAIPLLIPLLDPGNPAAMMVAARAVMHLAQNVDSALGAPAIPPLVQLLSPETPAVLQIAASSVLSMLAIDKRSRRAIVSAGGIARLVVLLGSEMHGVQGNAVYALLTFAKSADSAAALVEVGVVPPLLRMVGAADPKRRSGRGGRSGRGARTPPSCYPPWTGRIHPVTWPHASSRCSRSTWHRSAPRRPKGKPPRPTCSVTSSQPTTAPPCSQQALAQCCNAVPPRVGPTTSTHARY